MLLASIVLVFLDFLGIEFVGVRVLFFVEVILLEFLNRITITYKYPGGKFSLI